MFAVTQGAAARDRPTQVFQYHLSLYEWRARDIETVNVNEIKNFIHESRSHAAHCALQLLKTRASLCVYDHDLAVKKSGRDCERFHSVSYPGKLLCPVDTIAAPELDLAVIDPAKHSITVKLQFV